MATENRLYGYIRVSTIEQATDRQRKALIEAGVEPNNIKEDKASGKDFDRLAYQYLKTHELRAGDVLAVKELDRLGRNYSELKREWQELTDRDINIVVLDMPMLDTRKYKDGMEKVISNIVLELLSYIAESEKTKIRQRQAEGIALAKLQNKHLGRPFIPEPPEFKEVYKRWKAKELTAVQAMERLKIRKNTFYRMVNKYESKN